METLIEFMIYSVLLAIILVVFIAPIYIICSLVLGAIRQLKANKKKV